MGIQCFLPDCGHCNDYDKCKYYRIPKDLLKYYKWKHFLEAVVNVVNINEQLCAFLKLSQIMLLSFLCQSCTLFSLVLWSEFCVYVISHICTPKTKGFIYGPPLKHKIFCREQKITNFISLST